MCLLLKAHSNPLLCMVCHVATPSLSAWSSRAAMSDTVALPARRQQTASHRSSEELWQSTLVRVIRITLEVPRRSGKAITLRRTLHTARRPEIVRHCSRAFALLGWMLSVAAIVLAFHVVPTSARIRAPPRSPGDRSCRGVLEPPSPRSLFTHACRVSCAAGQSALLFVIMLARSLAHHSRVHGHRSRPS